MKNPVTKEFLNTIHLRDLEDEEIGVRHRICNFYLPIFREFCRQRSKPAESVRILDCGCGNGASAEYLAAEGYQAWGIDMAGFRLQQWTERSKLKGVTLILADATALPFPDRMFDVVLSSGMLEHIGVTEVSYPSYRYTPTTDRQARRSQFIAEVLRVLRPDGEFYLDHPNGAFPIDFWHNDWRARPRLHMPFERFLPSYREVKRIVRQIGPNARVTAISPADRFTFRRAGRRWYTKLFIGAMKQYFEMLQYRPFSALASSALNPYLVMRIRQHEAFCASVHRFA